MMTCLGVMAQDKGPAAIDTENFSVKVPKGWLIKEQKSGTSQVLALPLKGNGAIRIAVRSYPLTDKDVKAILKSIKVNK